MKIKVLKLLFLYRDEILWLTEPITSTPDPIMSKSVANIAEVNKGENSSIPGKQEQLLSRLEIFSQNLNSSETDLPNSLLTELPPRGETTKVFRGQKLFNCTVCNESFKTNRAMQMHLRQSHNLRHPDRNMFDCCFCSKIFHLKKDYHQHLTEDHGQSVSERYRFQLCACSDCGKMFYNSSALKTHVKAVHSKERLFQCDLCGKTFPTSECLYYLNQ